MPDPLPLARSCGSCQACCYTTPVKSDWKERPLIRKAGWKRCRYQSADGCRIYGYHPKACKTYTCLWINGKLDEDDRPDRSGLVVEVFKITSPPVGTVRAALLMEAWTHAAAAPPGQALVGRLVDLGYVIVLARHKSGPDDYETIHDPGGRLALAFEECRKHGVVTHEGYKGPI